MHRLVVLGVLLPGVLAAQSSQFGVRGLGIPNRPWSPRAIATGGGLGPFDLESSVNPAATGAVTQFTSLFTTAQNFRSSNTPFGGASGRDNRFPQAVAAGPIGGTNLAVSVSLSAYTDRSFALASTDTIELRGRRVGVFDTLASHGGLTDIRGALAWRVAKNVNFGVGLHAITGSNRIDSRRVFSDSAYLPAVEQLDLSYLGFGVSAGFTARFGAVTLAGMARSDGHANVERDTVRIGRTDLPFTVGGGLRIQPAQRVTLAMAGSFHQWSSADQDIKTQGGIGAEDSYEIGAGVEIVRNLKQPAHKSLRLGARYATLPFPLRAGEHGREIALSAGTGLRFTGGRGGLDLAAERVWRSEGGDFKERALVVTLGVSIRP